MRPKAHSIFTRVTGWITPLAISILLAGSGCKDGNQPARFALLTPERTGIYFSNTITENDSVNLLDYEYIYNGGGVAVIDVNADDLPDLFFSGNMVPSKLYLNEGGMRFRDITSSAGITIQSWATGVAVADVNADGLQDLYVCSAGHLDESARANLLYINNGDNTFTESAAAYGVADTGFSTMAAFLDYDLDGDLDLYVVTYANDTWDTNVIYPKVTDGTGKATDRLYRNNGNGTFTNISKEAGILVEGYGLGVAVCDINQDSWPDIYVSNDYIDDDFIYINNGNGTFTESASKFLSHISHFAMGNDVADINNDALPDIMVVDMQPEDNERQKLFSVTKNYDKFMMTLKMKYLPAYMRNTLQLNNGNGTFSEIGQLAGVHHTDWSWAPLLADFDNDGYKDLFITNGYPKDIMNRDFLVFNKYATSIQAVKTQATLAEQHRFKLQAITELQGSKTNNYIFKNNGNLTFAKQTAAWGFEAPSFSNGAAYADLDKDGDLDLVVNNINDPAFVYENRSERTEKNHFLRVKLIGDSLNRFALGATVKVYVGGASTQYIEHYPYRGFQSSVESVIHFGLGSSSTADSIEITWPDQKTTLLRDQPADRVIIADHTDAMTRPQKPVKAPDQLIRNITAAAGIDYVHKEPDFNDFRIQPLMTHKYSQNGPGIAAGDINGDGLSDFFIGGGQESPGAFYLQRANGTFSRRDLGQKDVTDDLGALLFDADGDADLDLYIVNGGNEQMAETNYYQDRLYRNDGKGNFTYDPDALPKMFDSGSTVAAADFDADGDLDLFIGGRIHPGKFPLPGKSHLLRNEGGHFKDVTEEIGGPGFARMGMVTTALWTDYDNDGQTDLMVAGEWMPITVYRNDRGRFVNVTNDVGLNHSTGWWNSIVSGDFDADGDTDYALGNCGKNTRYKPTAAEPLTMYTKDFDDNGTLDPFMSYYLNGEHHLVHSRDEVIGQLPMMRKRFPNYAGFATAEFSGIFSAEELKGAYILKAENFESSYLRNDDGKFTINALPLEAQFAPMFGMTALDANNDGNLDLLTVGNSYGTEIGLGRYDASFGNLLIGDGKGNFSNKASRISGFFLKGDSKGIATLVTGNGETMILVSQNNGKLEAFKANHSEKNTVQLQLMDAWALISFEDGRKRKVDLQYGSTYLSHSDRVLAVPQSASSIVITTFDGKRRTIHPQQGLSGLRGQ